MPKIALQKCDLITFTWFCGHYTGKNKDIALKFCMLIVCMYHYHIYSGFLDTLKILDFMGNYFWKNEILYFEGQNRKISKIQDSHFIERSIWRFFGVQFGVSRLRLTSKLNILAAFKHFLFVYPKWRNMASLKRHFLKISRRFFLKFWWQTSNWCRGRYWKFRIDICRRFWVNEKTRQRWAISPPPRSQRGAG